VFSPFVLCFLPHHVKECVGKGANLILNVGDRPYSRLGFMGDMLRVTHFTHKSQKDVMCGRHPKAIMKMACLKIIMLS